jgi:hypothetical protein
MIFRLLILFALLVSLHTGWSVQPPDTGYDRPIQPAERWERNTHNLVWNFCNMYQACVREVPDAEYPFRMWFFGWAAVDCNKPYPGCDAIFLGRSQDLEKWEFFAGEGKWDCDMNPKTWVPILYADEREYGSWHLGDPSVVLKDGSYYMAYSSTSVPDYRPMKDHNGGMILCVMGATSQDGIHWKKTDQPLLIEPPEMQHTGNEIGYTGDYHRPSLLWDEDKWRLWFDYWHPTQGLCMGYAENKGDFGRREGFGLVHSGTDALIYNWPNPEVIRVGDTYYSFADPSGYGPKVNDPDRGWTSRALCEAVSQDGLEWEITGFIAPDADAAACHVPQAFLRTIAGVDWLYLFYATQRGGSPEFDYRYDRIRAMRRKLSESDPGTYLLNH